MGLGVPKNLEKIEEHTPKHCEHFSNLHQVNLMSIQFTTCHSLITTFGRGAWESRVCNRISHIYILAAYISSHSVLPLPARPLRPILPLGRLPRPATPTTGARDDVRQVVALFRDLDHVPRLPLELYHLSALLPLRAQRLLAARHLPGLPARVPILALATAEIKNSGHDDVPGSTESEVNFQTLR